MSVPFQKGVAVEFADKTTEGKGINKILETLQQAIDKKLSIVEANYTDIINDTDIVMPCLLILHDSNNAYINIVVSFNKNDGFIGYICLDHSSITAYNGYFDGALTFEHFQENADSVLSFATESYVNNNRGTKLYKHEVVIDNKTFAIINNASGSLVGYYPPDFTPVVDSTSRMAPSINLYFVSSNTYYPIVSIDSDSSYHYRYYLGTTLTSADVGRSSTIASDTVTPL